MTLIPYDEMRRLCGLQDIAILDLYAMLETGRFDEFTIRRNPTMQVTVGGKPPGWTPPPKPLPPKGKAVPPMWANNPTKQRRTK